MTRPIVLVFDSYPGSAAAAVRREGGHPITVNPRHIDDVEKALNRPFDAVLLTGGGDVDPRLYGEKPHRKTYGVNEVRDLTEWYALDAARDAGVPVLGICRGMQLMAVHNGGRLKQHVSGHRGNQHLVFSEPRSTFRRAIGGGAGIFVSLHHQIVLRHGRGFRVSARDKAGRVEAIESQDGRCLGVQFHPEMDTGTNRSSRTIFRWLVLAAAKGAGLPEPTRVRPRRATVPLPEVKPSRRAGERTRPRRPRNPVRVSWQCPMCPIRFDSQVDRDDHVHFIHLTAAERRLEPPPHHPDWEDVAS